MRALLLGSAALLLLTLAACDGGSPDNDPDPTACGTVAQRADTVFVAVGEGTTLDLDALFAGVEGSALRYRLAGVPPSNGTVALGGDRGQAAAVQAVLVGARSFTVEATTTCGGTESVVGRAVVALHAVRPGTVCAVPPSSTPPETQRLAVGGLAAVFPLWGEGGLFQGVFDPAATFTYDPSALVGVTTVGVGGVPAVRLAPGSDEGTGVLTVTTQDACFRTVRGEIPVELVETPTCRIDYDPAALDYFPVGVGTRWTYAANRHDGAPSTSQTWAITGAAPCWNGARSYALSGASPYTGLVVEGDSIRILSIESGGDTPPMRRLYPVASAPPEVIEVGPWGQGSSLRLRRGVGVEWIDYRFRTDQTTHTLLEGPTAPFGGGAQNVTAAWRR